MAIWLLLLIGGGGGAVKTERVESELIAKHTTARPGTVLTVGLRLKLDPKWHVYWINPGDSGDRVYLKWTLPKGVQAGPIQWPGPHRILMPGEIMNFGYDGDLLLPIAIAVPRGFSEQTLKLAVKAEWLVCDDNMCIPGMVDLELVLPVSKDVAGQDDRWAPLFERATKRLPQPPPRDSLTAIRNGDTIELRTTMKLPPGAKLAFFPFQARQLVHSAPQPVTRNNGEARIELTAETEFKRLQGVLVIGGKETYRVDVPITDAPPSFPFFWLAGACVLVLGVVVLLGRRLKG